MSNESYVHEEDSTIRHVVARDSVRAHDVYSCEESASESAAPSPERESDERRRHPRVDLHTEVTFTDHTNFYTGFAEDLSEGGLFVATYALEPIGTKISLKLTLPDEREVEVTGTVRWLRDPRDHNPDAPPGMGIQFEDVASDDMRAIHEFVALRAPLFYAD